VYFSISLQLAHQSAGDIAPDASVHTATGVGYLSKRLGSSFVGLYFSSNATLPAGLTAISASVSTIPATLTLLRIAPNGRADAQTVIDSSADVYRKYAASEGSFYLIRPDGYVLGRWQNPDWTEINSALAPYRRQS
jgi:3-(3-hydroxy-phenyl)propionate hydroxylase